MVSIPFVIGGTTPAQVNVILFAYEGQDPAYIGADPVAFVDDDFPFVPLGPDVTTTAGFPYRARKYRARYKDRRFEADSPQELARQINVLARGDDENEISVLIETPRRELIRSRIPAATELDFIPTEDDDELAMLILLSQVL